MKKITLTEVPGEHGGAGMLKSGLAVLSQAQVVRFLNTNCFAPRVKVAKEDREIDPATGKPVRLKHPKTFWTLKYDDGAEAGE